MNEIFIVVEGYTELEFVKSILSYYIKENLPQQDISIIPLPVTTNANLGKKGGGRKYSHWKKDLKKIVQMTENRVVTTFMDYYALPENFPNYENCSKEIRIEDKLSCLEQAIKNDIAPNNYKFIPYIQKYEFEALLFSSNKGFENYYGGKIAKHTAEIIKKYPNPEDINDNPKTSPANRLKQIVPEYNKPNTGNILALEIGIDKMLEKCPRFKNWVETLIEKVQN